MISWLKSNGFLLGLLGMLGLAWWTPDWGAEGGVLRSEWTRRFAVFVIFFVQGLSLPTEELRRGLAAWRLHSFVLCWNYIGFPLLVFSVIWGAAGSMEDEIVFGFVYLSVLPTTITSAVFFTGTAKGDVAGAVFSTALSNLLSVILVPAGVAWLLLANLESSVSFTQMFLKLCQLIVLPLFLGQFLRPILRGQLPLWKPWFRRVTIGAIFFIMYCTFASGVKNAAWQQFGWASLLWIAVGACALLLVSSALVWLSSRCLHASQSTRIAAFYCGSQKSLATGVPMAASIFPASGSLSGIPDVSVIVLPLMCYHFLQLTLAARFADRFSRMAAMTGPEAE